MNEDHLEQLALQLARLLSEKKYTLVTAESCTGGWIAKTLTDVPGSSHWFERGFVTYTNESKHDMLAVDSRVIEEQGAVSEAVVRAMAYGALQASHAHLSIAVSGIAGPGGGTTFKPVGLVWFAWGFRHNEQAESAIETCQHIFSGDRKSIRAQAVAMALEGIIQRVSR